MSGLPTPIGSTLTSTAVIGDSNGDENGTNNTATTVTRTPSLDLSISIAGDPEGSYPGTTPGSSVEYTINFANLGSASVCGVTITDSQSALVSRSSTAHNFSSLSLTKADGSSTFPVTPGGVPITDPIVPFYNTLTHTFELGSGTNPHMAVCLPTGSRGSFKMYGTLDQTAATNTTATFTVAIGKDGAGVEDLLTNNTASSSVSIYRPDLSISKSAISCGTDGNCATTGDNSSVTANPNEKVRYTVSYDNVGNISAENPVISDHFSVGQAYIVGSLTTQPGSVLQFSNDNGATWTYAPVGAVGTADPLVTDYRMVFNGPITAPASFVGQDTRAELTGTVSSNLLRYEDGTLKLGITGAVAASLPGANSNGGHMVEGDFNNDGRMDAYLYGRGGFGVSGFFIQQADGSFTYSAFSTTPAISAKPVSIDLDADGDIDIARSGWGGGWRWLRNNGDGTFTQMANFSGHTDNHSAVAVADFNNDGMLDMVTGNRNGLPVAVYSVTQISAGVFSSVTAHFTSVAGLSTVPGDISGTPPAAYDVDGNGYKDVIMRVTTTTAQDQIIYFPNTAGVFSPSYVVIGTLPAQVQGLGGSIGFGTFNIVDFDNDGIRDIVVLSSWFKGLSTGGFGPVSVMPSNAGRYFVDINNDGLLDMWAPNHSSLRVEYKINLGNNVFTSTQSIPITNTIQIIGISADFSNDGLNDFILSNEAAPNTPSQSSPYIKTRYHASGTYTTALTAGAGFTAWDKLIVGQSTPAGTSILYDVYAGVSCTGTPVVTADPAADGYVNLGVISSASSTICVKATLAITDTSKTPTLDYLKATYRGTAPSYTYETRVVTPATATQISNDASISTTTPEVLTNNNAATTTLDVPEADIISTISVDKTAAAPGQVVTYTVNYENAGPNTGIATSIAVTLPALLTGGVVITPTTTSLGLTPTCAVAGSPQVVTCTHASFATGDRGSFTITTTIPAPTPAGSTLVASVLAQSTSYDPLLSNNSDATSTLIGNYANVYVEKIGQPKANVNKTIDYTISYGNSGSATASDFTLVDVYDSNLSIISITQLTGASLTCADNAGLDQLTCGGPGTNLAIGATGSIKVTASVADNWNLFVTNYKLQNTVTVSTSTQETSSLDNQSTVEVPVLIDGLAAVQARVIHDTDLSNTLTAGEPGLSGQRVFIAGVSAFGDVVGPDPVTYPTQYNALMAELFAQGLTPSLYSTSSLPPSRTTTGPINTDSTGNVQFSLLNPGNYTLLYTTTNYEQRFSTAGTNLAPVGDNGQGSTDAGPGVTFISGMRVGENETSTANLFGVLGGVISGTITDDLDATGTGTAGDQPLAGVQVSIYNDLDSSGTFTAGDTLAATTLTDTSGNYSVASLLLGNYVVVVTDSENVLSTGRYFNKIGTPAGPDTTSRDANGYATALTAGAGRITALADFGYTRLVVAGTLFNDLDNDGVQDSGETGLASAQVQLMTTGPNTIAYDGDDVIVTTVTTGVGPLAGRYTIPVASPGTNYYVRIPGANFTGVLTGYVSTTGTNGSATGASEPAPGANNDTNAVDDGTTAVTGLTTGGVTTGLITLVRDAEPTNDDDATEEVGGTLNPNSNRSVDFGFYAAATVSDYVWFDRNANGVQQITESGIDGVTITLTRPGIGPDGIAGNGDDAMAIGTYVTGDNPLLAGTQRGWYRFNYLIPSTYTVTVTNPQPGVLEFSPANSSATTDLLDSDVNITTGAVTLTLAASELNTSTDAALFYPTVVTGQLFEDRNDNGIFEPAIDGVIPSVEISIYQDTDASTTYTVGDVLIGTETTDILGEYIRDGLPVDDYIVVVTDGTATLSGGNYRYKAGPTPGTDNHSQDPAGYAVTTSPSHLFDATGDFGYQRLSVGNSIFDDANNNGLQDSGEVGIPSVPVELIAAGVDTSFGTGDDVVVMTATTQTGVAAGKYLFIGMAAGTYRVRIAASVLASGGALQNYRTSSGTNASLTGPYEPAESPHNDQNARDHGTRLSSGLVTSGDLVLDYLTEPTNDGDLTDEPGLATNPNSNLSVDFGFVQRTDIAGTIWLDVDANSTIDGGETLRDGDTINLFRPGFGLDGVAGNADDALPVATRTSGDNPETVGVEQGAYVFQNLIAGSYQVVVTRPAGLAFSQQQIGVTRSSVATFTGNLTVAATYGTPSTVNAGLSANAEIQGVAWFDQNGNGVREVGEPFVSGATAILTRNGASVPVGIDGIHGTADDALSGTQTTTSTGAYRFQGLGATNAGDPLDRYMVTFTFPNSYQATSRDQGGNDAIDSDISTTTLQSSSLALTPSQVLSNVDAGAMLPANGAITVTTMIDFNGNGSIDTDDVTRSGVTIQLVWDANSNGALDSGEAVRATATTDATGVVTFSNLLVEDGNDVTGTQYLVKVTDTAGRVKTFKLSNANAVSASTALASRLTPATPATSYLLTYQPQANLVDPPSGLKSVDASGIVFLKWKMVWINMSIANGVLGQIVDGIPSGTTYRPGTIACEARGTSVTHTCGFNVGTNQVEWTGTVGADFGHDTEENSLNEIVITFDVDLPSTTNTVENQARMYWDQNGDGVIDKNDANFTLPAISNDPATTTGGDPTKWVRPVVAKTGDNILFVSLMGLLLLVGAGFLLRVKR
jgi:uncharacterized repeat protein (TIGR01451 family)